MCIDGQQCKILGHQITLVATDKNCADTPSGSNLGRVINGDAVIGRDDLRVADELRVNPHERMVRGDRVNALDRPCRSFVVVPRNDYGVRHLEVRNVKCRGWINDFHDSHCAVMLLIVAIFNVSFGQFAQISAAAGGVVDGTPRFSTASSRASIAYPIGVVFVDLTG